MIKIVNKDKEGDICINYYTQLFILLKENGEGERQLGPTEEGNLRKQRLIFPHKLSATETDPSEPTTNKITTKIHPTNKTHIHDTSLVRSCFTHVEEPRRFYSNF